VGPTPYLYNSAYEVEADGAIMITGSHNPGNENGFKIMRGRSSFYGEAIQTLRARIEADDLPLAAKAGGISQLDRKADYVASLTKGISFARTNMRFVLDAGNGAGGPLALEAMRKLGLSPDPLFCEMDGRFPNHHPDPTVEKNLEALVARVRETGAEIGLAFDGDADRLGAVDAKGNVIWGDKLLVLFARQVLEKNPGAAVLGEVKCSQTLYDDIAKHGGRPIVWKTGHSLIKAKMKEEHALLAGEMSGHLFFADRYFGYDDALYAALRLLEIVAKETRTVGDMLADLPATVMTPELRVDCPDAVKFDVVRAVTEHYQAAGREVLTIDGARISFGAPGEPCWGLVRASNTGPVLVLRFEAPSAEKLAEIRAEVEGVVEAARARFGG
jgi:phosphomannomutase/phosphoglucomutase